MEHLIEVGIFSLEVFVVTVAVVIGLVFIRLSGGSAKRKGSLSTTDLGESLSESIKEIRRETVCKKTLKEEAKAEKKKGKISPDKTIYVLDFNGDVHAKQVFNLRREVDAVLSVATDKDEVLIRLESGGGVVHGYGLAASQLERIKSKGILLTVSVDKVAASGGYMMACVADKIISAPFAIIGSVGVVAQIPNFNRLLKKLNVDFEELTAGEFKRTITMFGENTDNARDKFKSELNETHGLFKEFVSENRPSLDVPKIATGEHWFGKKALSLGLVDEIGTSDEYIMDNIKNTKVLLVEFTKKKSFSDKFSQAASITVEVVLNKLVQIQKNANFL